MIVVVDYGASNLHSVLHALAALGAGDVRLAQQPEQVAGASKVILPGQGAFGAGIQQVRARGLDVPVLEHIRAGKPYLGICLGMQYLFESSDEMGSHSGFGVLPGRVTRFPDQPGLKVPHMGWNRVQPCQNSKLLRGLPAESYAYFVHSYYCAPANPADTLLTADYGGPFCAAVERDNVYGVQFHPEKSQRTGLQMLKNFLELPA